jgi:hypothetical protein
MEAAGSSETLACIYDAVWGHISLYASSWLMLSKLLGISLTSMKTEI